jgi:uncharacterized protein (DUF58 family)
MFKFRPTVFLIKMMALLLLMSVVQLFYPELTVLFRGLCIVVSVIVLGDLFTLFIPSKLSVERVVPQTVPLSVPMSIKVKLFNDSNHLLKLSVFDHYPTEHSVENLPISLSIQAHQNLECSYQLTPLERGLSIFEKLTVRQQSPLSFWHSFSDFSYRNEMKVYPNYSEVMKYGALAGEQRLSQMGIHKRRHRGLGTEFHQLRDFRQGDRLGDIDWKASARQQKIIAKSYQVERDQQIFFLVDCGRRMRSFDGELSHFDHALNAMLLLTYVASRQGDAVGMMTFAGENRWLSPQKSSANVNRFLNSLYDLKPTTEAADFTAAAEKLSVMLKKRALVIVLSNLRDEDDEDLQVSLRLLRQKHLVVFAALKEEVFKEEDDKPLSSFTDALRYAALNNYMSHREAALERLKSNKVMTMDVAPSLLHIELVNRYFEIKSSSQL